DRLVDVFGHGDSRVRNVVSAERVRADGRAQQPRAPAAASTSPSPSRAPAPVRACPSSCEPCARAGAAAWSPRWRAEPIRAVPGRRLVRREVALDADLLERDVERRTERGEGREEAQLDAGAVGYTASRAAAHLIGGGA